MAWINTQSFYGANQIVTETNNAVLAKVTGTSWLVWVPKKCCRWSGKGNVRFGFNTDFEYVIFKKGKGRYNWKDTIAEQKVTGTELLEMFGC